MKWTGEWFTLFDMIFVLQWKDCWKYIYIYMLSCQYILQAMGKLQWTEEKKNNSGHEKGKYYAKKSVLCCAT